MRGAGIEPARSFDHSILSAAWLPVTTPAQTCRKNYTGTLVMLYNECMKRVCSVCDVSKLSSEFYVKDGKKGLLHSQCKDCYKRKRKEFMAVHYEKYGDQYRSRARARKAIIKRLRQDQLYEYMSDKSCETCGVDDIRVLEFDHIEPSLKRFGIARAITNCYAWEEILLEIAKCRILCANCHKIRTAEQQNWRKWRLGRAVRRRSAKPQRWVRLP